MLDIIEKLDETNRKLVELQFTPNKPREDDDIEEPLLNLLPIKSFAVVKAFDKKLIENPAIRTKLIKVFHSVGGADIKSLTINILRRTLTDSTAQSFSFTGKKGYKDERKEAFVNTEIFKAINTAIRKVLKESYSEDKVKKHVATWLNQAKTRLTRREERRISAEERGRDDDNHLLDELN